MNESLVRFEIRGKVAVLTLCDPPANTYSYDMLRRLDACILDARMDGEVEVIVLTSTGGTQRLPRLVGKSKAIELMISSRNLDVAQATELGLVNETIECAPAEFLDAVLARCADFTTPGAASMAIGHIKRSVQSGNEMALEQGLALERELQAKLFASDDAREGLAAFNEKRAPRFTGR